MRCPSPPPPLKFLAEAATTTMSSRPTYRGGRSQWRRGFSDRPYPGRGGRGQGQGQFVTGDSHFRSVRDANLGFRQGDSGTFANQNAFRPPPYTQNAQFRQPPPSYNYNYNYNNQRPQFRHPPPFHQTQAFRPRPPKPLDYRNWEYANTELPSNCERFTVLSYNILAEYLANSHRSKLYFHIPPHMLDWKWRKRSILFELGLWSTDIMCFQEVDRFQDLEEELKLRGYSGIWKMRTGIPVDGCAIFWRTSRFKLLHEECIEFIKLGLRDNVAQICVLELMNQSCTNETAALPTSSTGSNKVVICNVHVLFNPKRGDIKLGQVRVLLDRAYAVSKLWNDAPVILCGDFNCTPKSPLYNFISEQKLDLSGLDRDKLSGQAAAEIRAAKPYNPNPGAGSANNAIQASSMVDGREMCIKLSNSISDMQESSNPDSDVQNLPAINNVSQPQCTNTVLDVSDGFKDKGILHDEVKKESEQTAIDGFKESSESASCVPTVGFGGDSSTSYSEGGFPVDLNEIHKYIPPVASDPEEVYSDATYTGYREKADAPSNSNNGSLCGHSESSDYIENEGVNCDNPRNLSSRHIATDENGSSSSQYQASISCASTSIDFIVDEKLENLSINEHDESTAEGGPIGEDDSTFLSALHDTEDELDSVLHNSPSNLQSNKVEDDVSPGLDSEPVDMEKTLYDPSLWTPMEIETATGNADCTLLEHPLTLNSTYTEVQDCSGTRDSNGEPLVTSYHRCFFGTVDYIWHSEGLQTVRVLAPIPKHAMQWTPGFPTKKWGSDHIALASEFALVKGS